MRIDIVLLIGKQFWANAFKTRAMYLLLSIMVVLLIYSTLSGIHYIGHNHFRTDHQEMARKSWEDNPDKHPHRMAHFGTFAFRLKHPLSLFDFGMESFTGNAVFLEAHQQNMVNFSEAGLSSGLLRFGELSMAMVLQTILPLIIFFVGYAAIVADREKGTLKILLTQGATWKEILFGKSLGLMMMAFLFGLLFLMVLMGILVFNGVDTWDEWGRFVIIAVAYLLFIFILCLITVAVSTNSRSSKNALIKLLGIWLLMLVLLPRTSQALGTYLFPTPTKLEFRSAIEKEVIKNGDSHNPDDPHFLALKDSVLKVHAVSSVEELPFNYGGFVMSQGEKLTAEIYNKHHHRLLDRYRDQNQLNQWLALINPYLALKNLSMALSGTDFEAYVDFQRQSESYRYQLAQKMNRLQMEHISAKKVSGSEGKAHVVDRAEWKSFPDFQHHYLANSTVLRNGTVSIVSLVLWTFIAIAMLMYLSKRAKAI